jgi:DNA-binding NarL/FixJ family response regulator
MEAQTPNAPSKLSPALTDLRSEIYVGIVMSHALAAQKVIDLLEGHYIRPVVLGNGVSIQNAFPEAAKVVVIVDLWGSSLAGSNYLDTSAAVAPDAAFLALDKSRSDIDVAYLLRAGFAGFVAHDQAFYMLISAVRAVAEGQVWASPEVLRIYMNLTSSRAGMRSSGSERLTVRENQILDLLKRRYSNKEMANLLGVSESTIKFHVSNVLAKLNVNDRRDVKEREPGIPTPSFVKLVSKVPRALPIPESSGAGLNGPGVRLNRFKVG